MPTNDGQIDSVMAAVNDAMVKLVAINRDHLTEAQVNQLERMWYQLATIERDLDEFFLNDDEKSPA